MCNVLNQNSDGKQLFRRWKDFGTQFVEYSAKNFNMKNNTKHEELDMRNQKGFTLIELIMVIVILGILAAVVVPRFFDFTTDAHKANVEAFVGNLKSALEMSAAENIVDEGYKAYPKGSEVVLTDLLDQIPDDWAASGATGNRIDFVYSGDTNGDVKLRYTCNGNNGSDYTLTLVGAKYGWDNGHSF